MELSAMPAQTAPITILPVVIPDYQGQEIGVPITVKNFTNIRAVSLTFNYDPSVMEYLDFEDTAGYGLSCGNTVQGKIVIGGFNDGMSFEEDAVLCTPRFRFIQGHGHLTWFTENPASCEYAGMDLQPLPSDPKSEYFINGEVHLIWSVIFNADADDATFGNADGQIKMHICAREGEILGAPIVPGNAPFTVQLKVDGNLVRTITNIPACEDYENMNFDPNAGPIAEVNCLITDLPSARYDVVVTDAVGNDARGFTNVFEVQPPYATLNGTVDPNGLNTNVYFDFGLTAEYDRVAEFGIVNGTEPVHCSMRLKSKVEGSSDPTEYLEADTEYHYRIRAANEMGESFGEDMTFRTPFYGAPPVAVTLPATNIG